MANEIQFTSDKTGAIEKVKGSDGRQNVSSRSDSRAYYNSRDEGQTYSAVYEMTDASVGEYVVYLKNTSTTGKTLVLEGIGANSINDASFKLWFVTGTATDGNPGTPINLNKESSNSATADAREGGAAATGIGGLTTDGLIDLVFVKAGGHEEFRLRDRLRLGQNDAIAIEYDRGTTGDVAGVIFGYLE